MIISIAQNSRICSIFLNLRAKMSIFLKLIVKKKTGNWATFEFTRHR